MTLVSSVIVVFVLSINQSINQSINLFQAISLGSKLVLNANGVMLGPWMDR